MQDLEGGIPDEMDNYHNSIALLVFKKHTRNVSDIRNSQK